MTDYVASVPYCEPPLDFSKELGGDAEVSVSRTGPQRRVRLRMDPARLADVRARLPKYIVLEPVMSFTNKGVAAH